MCQRTRLLVTFLTLLVTTLGGCSRVDEAASTQTQRLRESEQQVSEDLRQQGWELSKSGMLWSGRYNGEELPVEMLKRLQTFQRFSELDVSDRKLTKDHVKAISELDSLMKLHAAGTNIDDSDLDTLDACPQLALIDARDTKVTPAKAKAWVTSRRTSNSISIFARSPKIQTGSR